MSNLPTAIERLLSEQSTFSESQMPKTLVFFPEEHVNFFDPRFRALRLDIGATYATLLPSNSFPEFIAHLARFGGRYARVILVSFGKDTSVLEGFLSDASDRITGFMRKGARLEAYRIFPDGRHTPDLLSVPPRPLDVSSLEHWATLEDMLA